MNERRMIIKYPTPANPDDPSDYVMESLLARRPELADMSLNARFREMALECA